MKNEIKKRTIICAVLMLFFTHVQAADKFVQFNPMGDTYQLATSSEPLTILYDANDDEGIIAALQNLQQDFLKVLSHQPAKVTQPAKNVRLIIGSLQSNHIQELIKQNKIDPTALEGKNEKYIITTLNNPFDTGGEALVIAGSDKRGTIYGIYELSTQIGVSPWYYWADVPVKPQPHIYIRCGTYTDGEPAVKYRGIFLNDEWPALGMWAQSTFGGFNSRFYEKIFELILRLKGNFLWPAMWNSAFYDDDPMNGPLAHKMGIVMSTSHHEPMSLAQKDWSRRRNGAWNYNTNARNLKDFWQFGIERSKNWEQVVTIGMRGDGDEAMESGTNLKLLEQIVKDQRRIISDVTRKKASQTPQVWALYKEVQDYYDNGMRVPDDVTLLFCDDNWGNVRQLPQLTAKPRKGGYGMYYHFDYVGAPRNSKWLNVSQVPRIWEQMNLTYQYGVKEIWVVNVGDLKPMEYPIQFFMDMAWNPERFNENNLYQHAVDFCARQFGEEYAQQSARLLNLYTKYNRRVTPEMLNWKTYSLHNYDEFRRVTDEYNALLLDALRLNYLLPQEVRNAYDQLILYPIYACANLYEMYYSVAMNHDLAEKNDPEANYWADKVQTLFARDSLLTAHYHTEIAGGKWKHIMSQVHIGYKSWNEPKANIMPPIKRVNQPQTTSAPTLFIEKDGYVSIEAPHYTRALNPGKAQWITIPHLGKTTAAITTTPVTIQPDAGTWVEYDIELASTGEAKVEMLLAPTLNFNGGCGLRYAVSIDGGKEEVVNFNGHYRGELGKWQAEHIIKSTTVHQISSPGKHTLRFRVLDPGIVLQKIMIDMGGLKPSWLGAPETRK